MHVCEPDIWIQIIFAKFKHWQVKIETHRVKREVDAYANSKGPDQTAHMRSLI